jgi:CxxC motif-containing protein (DUF1111 family)
MKLNKTVVSDVALGRLKQRLRIFILAGFAVALMLPFTLTSPAQIVLPVEAASGFDGLTNGFESQEQFDLDRTVFEQRKYISDGLGPVYNAQSCVECHQNPVTGGISQTTNLRAGHLSLSGNFVDHPGGSLINDRAIDPSIQERVLGGNEVRTFRTSLNLLGDGYVECISNDTLVSIRNSQPAEMRGQVIQVPVLEASGATRRGRFGWKNQHASLLSASAEEYLNQIGVTNIFFPSEDTSSGRDVAAFDGVSDPEDTAGDLEAVVRFLRSTKAPPRDTSLGVTIDAQIGSSLFNIVGCSICHVRTIATAPPGTIINGGAFRVPAPLGSKIIHPFSDFLLHNVGTGDGVVQNGDQSTRNKLRTPPLWGLRTRDRLMHDGATLTRNEAILRHAGEATSVINSYRALTNLQKIQLIAFLDSL